MLNPLRHTSQSLWLFWNGNICLFIIELRVILIFWIPIFYQIYKLQIFSPILWIVFHFYDEIIFSRKVCNFDEVQFIFLLLLVLLVSHLKKILNSKPWRFIPINSKSFILLALTLRFMIHFRLNFVYGVRWGFELILWHVDIQLSQKHFL